MTPTPEVSRAVLNGALDLVRQSLKNEKSVDKAIDAAVADVRSRHAISTLDEARLRGWLEKELEYIAAPTKRDERPKDSALYRMVAPGRFVPVHDKAVAVRSPFRFGRRKAVVAVAAAAFLLTALFPPWLQTLDHAGRHTRSDAGYSFILSPPRPKGSEEFYGIQLDLSRLLIEWVCIFAVGGAACFLFEDVRSAEPSAEREAPKTDN